jgi:hypothetical protein
MVLRSQAERIFDGIRANSLFKGSLLPVMITNTSMVDVVRAIDHLHGTILPTSNRKIAECKVLFDKFVDANALVEGMQKHEAYTLAAGVMTPKMFMHGIKSMCLADPQKIVLPEVRGDGAGEVGPGAVGEGRVAGQRGAGRSPGPGVGERGDGARSKGWEGRGGPAGAASSVGAG